MVTVHRWKFKESYYMSLIVGMDHYMDRKDIMLTAKARELVKATVPILQQHGETLTRHFYARMFSHNPGTEASLQRIAPGERSATARFGDGGAGLCRQYRDPAVLMPVLQRVAA